MASPKSSASSAAPGCAAADPEADSAPTQPDASDTETSAEPAARRFELNGWKCEVLSGYGPGCLGLDEARAVTRGGVQVIFTNDSAEKLETVNVEVLTFLLTGREP